jgi:hypothetical protein
MINEKRSDNLSGLKTDELLRQVGENNEKVDALRYQRNELTTELYNLQRFGTDGLAESERRRMELIGAALWHFFTPQGKTQELEALAIHYLLDVVQDAGRADLALLGLPDYEKPVDQDFNTLKRLKTLLQLGLTPPPVPSEVARQKRAVDIADMFPDLLSQVTGAFDDDDDDDEL